jgi:HD-GYP domain-containing protein (c-di-GMP phosphodiesterase class II)
VFVCDAFDAMTTERRYTVPRSQRYAIEELRRAAGTQFDSTVVSAFIQVWHERDSPAVAAELGPER